MLSIIDFGFLRLHERAQYVYNKGQYIRSKNQGSHRITLYSLGSYYAEVVYDAKTRQLVNVVSKEPWQEM